MNGNTPLLNTCPQIAGSLIAMSRIRTMLDVRRLETGKPVVGCSEGLPLEGAVPLVPICLNICYSDTVPFL